MKNNLNITIMNGVVRCQYRDNNGYHQYVKGNAEQVVSCVAINRPDLVPVVKRVTSILQSKSGIK